jgi:hypothetical protein
MNFEGFVQRAVEWDRWAGEIGLAAAFLALAGAGWIAYRVRRQDKE